MLGLFKLLIFLISISLTLIFSVSVFINLFRKQARKSDWNKEIEQLARARGFTHQLKAPLPDYIRNANLATFRTGNCQGVDRKFDNYYVTHLLHGFMNNIEVTIFYYTCQIKRSSYYASTVGTAVAFRHNPNSIPAVFVQEGDYYVSPQNLPNFIGGYFGSFISGRYISAP
ncbi:MAG: hypothetical protein K1X72_21720 [Pyrinomonadaceae bacterium]|nr:hypothetical protein [Pyrinomonadaceae bacterium]